MSIANEKQPLPRARMRRNGAVRLMDAAALAVLAGWLALALGVWYPQYAADTAAAEELEITFESGYRTATQLLLAGLSRGK